MPEGEPVDAITTEKNNRKRKLVQNGSARPHKQSKANVSENRVCSVNEKRALENMFSTQIRLGKVPGKLDCLNAQRNATCLAHSPWKKIKFAVYNIIKFNSRKKFAGLLSDS